MHMKTAKTSGQILVNHRQGLTVSFGNYHVSYHHVIGPTIKFCVWNNFLSKKVNAGHISINSYAVVTVSCKCR